MSDKKRSKRLRSRPNTNWRPMADGTRVVCSETRLRADDALFGAPAMRCLRFPPHPHRLPLNHRRTRNERTPAPPARLPSKSPLNYFLFNFLSLSLHLPRQFLCLVYQPILCLAPTYYRRFEWLGTTISARLLSEPN